MTETYRTKVEIFVQWIEDSW